MPPEDDTALGAQDDYYDTGAIRASSYGHGTAIGSNSSNPRTGTVNITAGAVIDTKIEGYEAAPSYHYYANAINFIDTEEGCSCVQYDSALAASAISFSEIMERSSFSSSQSLGCNLEKR